MNWFKVPKYMFNDIDRTNMKFFRDNNKETDIKNNQCTIQTITWDMIYRPKAKEGMGLKNMGC